MFFLRREKSVEDGDAPQLDIQSIIKLSALGVVIIVTYVLNTVGAFTPGWIVVTTKNGSVSKSEYHGIFESSDNASGFVIAAAFSIVLAVVTFFLVAFYFGRAVREIYKFGYSLKTRNNFYAMVSGAVVNVAFTITAVPLVAKTVADYNSTTPSDSVTFSLGYSAWLCVGSVAVSFGIIGISMYIALEDCVDEKEQEEQEPVEEELPPVPFSTTTTHIPRVQEGRNRHPYF